MSTPSLRKMTSKISPALRRAIGAEAEFCGGEPRPVSGKALTALKAVLASPPSPDIDRKRALSLLAKSSPSPDTVQRIGEVLADPSRPLAERLRASSLLGVLEGGEDCLLAVLGTAEEPLRSAVVQALGQIGGPRALPVLRKMRKRNDSKSDRKRALAELAIALRTEPASVTRASLKKAFDLGWKGSPVTTLDTKSARAVVKSIKGSRWGIDLSTDRARSFACGSRDTVVLLNAALKSGSYVDRLKTQSMVAAVIVARDKDAHFFVLRWLVITVPDRKSVHMALVNANGDTAFAGEAVPDERGLRFRLRDTGFERLPTEAEGVIGAEDIGFSIQIALGAVRPKGRPLAIRSLVAK